MAPKPMIGLEALNDLSDFINKFGVKQRKKNNSELPWKKRSIFFELSYWVGNACSHNLDVMHIEKNICDNLIGTLLDISEKTN